MFGSGKRVLYREKKTARRILAIVLSGDSNGFGGVPKAVAEALHADGHTVLWFDCYARWAFAHGDNREALLNDVLESAKEAMPFVQEVLVVGYSFGADIVPWVADHLRDNKLNVPMALMLEPGEKAAFKPKLRGWVAIEYGTEPILPKLLETTVATMIFCGDTTTGMMRARENSPAREPNLSQRNYNVRVKVIGGDHTFDRQYDKVVEGMRLWFAAYQPQL